MIPKQACCIRWISLFVMLIQILVTTAFIIPTYKQIIPKTRHNTIFNYDQSLSLPSTNKIQDAIVPSSSHRSILLLRFLSPLDLWEEYNIALNNEPLLVKSITAGILLGAADLTGQAFEKYTATTTTTPDVVVIDDKRISSRTVDLDFFRTIRFAIFGLILQAPWNHYYYLVLDSQIPPTPDDPFSSTNMIKVGIDQFIQAPIFTILIFIFLGLLEGKAWTSIQQQLENDYKDTIIANCMYMNINNEYYPSTD
jgi:hypothetical protein